ncbi:MAG: phosphotransferase [Rhodospirillales bacterium]|jgi:thiamine kinase-like enzyme|nr:phosphotransferase [Rhodospirillales bacterium]MBT4006505.1 phosphotransferase [Rhodospirillales bacterium]MBT5075901.1 phosphotransferase [Rhodospirillales bacterium]MBT5113783.1 phosphotransferase [Rhodospirillales bacterium]MBT5672311.1 phosphotransferase [Rhodospirillales bacterium]
MTQSDPRDVAESLARSCNLGKVEHIEEMDGGGNNRLFRMVFKNQTVVLKHYFSDQADKRDRLGKEFSFLQFAWGHKIDILPQPLAKDPDANIALYTMVEGRVMTPDDITDDIMSQTHAFIASLNALRTKKDATDLSAGSESCFSLSDHLTTVDQRMERLSTIDDKSPEGAEARQFVADELIPFWKALSKSTREAATNAGIVLSGAISMADRCLSPSDFGFHNALLDQDGTVRFLDFEYAGWDDPAKLVGDFFNQVAVPVPHSYLDGFTDAIAALTPNPDATKTRVKLLLPIYGCKWLCIILGDFLPVATRRRQFAAAKSPDETAQRQKDQLAKARRKLDVLHKAMALE